MGAAASTSSSSKPEWMNIFNIMQLTKYELTAFDEIFRSVDVENTGSIDVGVMLNYLGIKNSFFSERIFIYDEQCLGRIDFFEFVLALWKFCSFNKESMGKIIMIIYLLCIYIHIFLRNDYSNIFISSSSYYYYYYYYFLL